jgi:hypothetical protein
VKLESKVTALITVVSIIAGFMFAYGALNMQMLTYWADHKASLVGTAAAGIYIYGIVLTSLVSILFLYWSLDAETKDFRYKWGFALFLLTIALSMIYAVLTAESIYTFTVTTNSTGYHVPRDLPLSWVDRTWWIFEAGVVVLALSSIFVAVLHLKSSSKAKPVLEKHGPPSESKLGIGKSTVHYLRKKASHRARFKSTRKSSKLETHVR